MAKNYLETIKDYEKTFQEGIEKKIQDKEELLDYELDNYKLTEEDVDGMEVLTKVMDGEHVPGFVLMDFLASPSARVLIPKVIIGKARRAADPIYLASKMYKKMKLKNGTATHFPEFGVLRAYDIAEGGEIPQESLDWQLNSDETIKIGKTGLRLQWSEDLLRDIEFDLLGIMMEEAGRALARHAEQKAFREWQLHSWTVFDNDLYAEDPIKYDGSSTNGLDIHGEKNETLSVEDYLDLVIALYNNGFNPTHLVMHSLAWPAFMKQGFTGGLSAPYEREAKRESTNGTFPIGPGSIQGRLPFNFNVELSNFAPINREAKTFNLFCVDANNVGFKIVRDEIRTEEFKDPARDLLNCKFVERYGFGTSFEGRAVCSAKNISMAKSYPTPERVIITESPKA